MECVCQISLLQAADSGKEDWTKLSFRDPVVIRKASDVALAAAASKSLVSDIPTCTLLLPYHSWLFWVWLFEFPVNSDTSD